MKTTLRPGTLEHVIVAHLPAPIDPLATYTVRTHERTHDGKGRDTNTPATIAENVDAEEMLAACRARFDAINTNYPHAPARIRDIVAHDTLDTYEDSDEQTTLTLELFGRAFVDIETTRPRWTVNVGNIGEVHSSHSYPEALADFEEYMAQSETGCCRASGEVVTLFADGEPYAEHEPEPSEYDKAEEILESIANGQRTQARQQFAASGLSIADMIDHQEGTDTNPADILKTVRALYA